MLCACYVFKTLNVTFQKRKKFNEIKGLEKKKIVMLYKYEILRIIYMAYLEYIALHFALADTFCPVCPPHTFQKKRHT